MPTLRAVFVYRLLEVVDVDHGHWCPRCLLPAANVVTLASQLECRGQVGPLRLSRGLHCPDGHGWLPWDPDAQDT